MNDIPVPGKEQPFGPWTASAHCTSHVHCAACQGFTSDAEGARATWTQLWVGPKDWVCPYGRTRQQIEKDDAARAAATALRLLESESDRVVSYVSAMPTELSALQRVDTLGRLVQAGVCTLEVAEAAAEKLGIDLDAEAR